MQHSIGATIGRSTFDRSPEQVPFPPHQFSIPARYNQEGQTFAIGDLVWYEIKGNHFDIQSGGLQWGEAIVKEILPGTGTGPGNRYKLAGKTWSYDHLTHPLIGEQNGPPHYSSVDDIHMGRNIYKKWAAVHHPNSHVRRMALSGVDEVMHPALSSVPGEAIFKVWDREEIPVCPIITINTSEQHEHEQSSSSSSQQDKTSTSLEDARKKYGEDLQFKGMKQNNFGPEFWGITLEQIQGVKDLPGYNEEMKMYDVVNTLIKPITKGKGMGYSLLLNTEKPLRAKQMVSHAWGEQYSHFVKTLQYSGYEGPFWVCALAIYQEDEEAVAKQLGPSIEHGPFATVLKQATDMIAVFTPAADIYLRMWCVFEIFIAVKLGVDIRFAGHNQQYRSGIQNIYDAIYEHGQRRRCDSMAARCGNDSDEQQIREVINSSDGKFELLDSVVEWCKASYYIREVRHPGPAFKSKPAHILLLGGSGKFDYLAKTLSAVAISMDRISTDVRWNETSPNPETVNNVNDGTCNGGKDIFIDDELVYEKILCCCCRILQKDQA